MHATLFELEGKRQAESRKVAQDDTEEATRRDTASAVDRAQSANVDRSVDANHRNGHLDQKQIGVEVGVNVQNKYFQV